MSDGSMKVHGKALGLHKRQAPKSHTDYSRTLKVNEKTYNLSSLQVKELEKIRNGKGGKLLKDWFNPSLEHSLLFSRGKPCRVFEMYNRIEESRITPGSPLDNALDDATPHRDGGFSTKFAKGSFGLLRLVGTVESREILAVKKVNTKQFIQEEIQFQTKAAEAGLALPIEGIASYEGKHHPVTAIVMPLGYGDMESIRQDMCVELEKKYPNFDNIMDMYFDSLNILTTEGQYKVESITEVSFGAKKLKEFLSSLDERVSLAEEIVTLVEGLHKLNIAHCDLKAENIFIDSDGSLKLGDFGLSRNPNETTGGAGSDPYRDRDIDVNGLQGDQYSLGIMLKLLLEFPGNPESRLNTREQGLYKVQLDKLKQIQPVINGLLGEKEARPSLESVITALKSLNE